MTLFELTSRNVKRNFRLYTIYLVSMIVSVMIYFTFVALTYNETLMSAMEYQNNFTLSMSIASTCTLLFIFMFVMYANGFFTRHRKKEFGTYLILGMKERQLSTMIFYENLIISAISIIVGVLMGGLLSKFFAMIVLKLMVYHEDISISFPPMAILQTAIVFLILSLVVSLQAFYIIRRVKLRELFYAAQKAEKPIKVSFLLSALSVLLLGTAYFLISRGWESTIWKEHTPFALITTAVGIILGTYLFFRQFIALVVYVFEKSRHYVESDRLLWLSSIRSQIRSNATHLTFITLFSAMLLFFVAFVVVNYQVQFYAVKKNLPNTIAYQTVTEQTQTKINDAINTSDHPVIFHEQIALLPITSETPLNVAFESLDYYVNQPFIVSQTTYNKIIQLRGDKQKVDLEKNEAVSLAQGTNTPIVYDKTRRPELTFTSNGTKETIQFIEKKDYALLGWMSSPDKSMSKKIPITIVSDELYNKLQANSKEISFDLYHLENNGIIAHCILNA